jgi:ribosome biogenesis protein NSA1
MRIITGDEVGLLKIIYQNDIISIGEIDKKKSICCLAIDKQYVTIARENGQVEIFDLDKKSMLYTKKVHSENTKFIGIFLQDGLVATCTDNGLVSYFHWTGKHSIPQANIDLKVKDLCCFRVHPNHINIFVTGGKECELSRWNLSNLIDKNPVPEWKAKNVKNDHLDLRVKVWVTDIQFVNSDVNEILISTGYHHVRYYDTRKQKRPLTSYSIGEFPIKSICIADDEYVFSDTTGLLMAMNPTTGLLCGSFKGIAGAVTRVLYTKDTIITVGMDRYLRLFNHKTRKIASKHYLKNRLTSVVVDPDYEIQVETEDIWKEIPTVHGSKGQSDSDSDVESSTDDESRVDSSIEDESTTDSNESETDEDEPRLPIRKKQKK